MTQQVVYNEDCLPAMRQITDNAFDLAVVDPPYGIGIWSMDFTKSGAIRPHGQSVAKRKDYRRTDDWDTLPSKEYFDELLRVSRKQIVWGGELLYRFFTTIKKFHCMGQTVQ